MEDCKLHLPTLTSRTKGGMQANNHLYFTVEVGVACILPSRVQGEYRKGGMPANTHLKPSYTIL